MSNVVLMRRRALAGEDPTVPALVDLLARRRRQRHDPFWLKENAELAQILAATRKGPGAERIDLSPLEDLAARIASEIRFFPQYYRLYLSLAVDLAALGMPGIDTEALAAFVRDEGLVDGELGDVHRREAALLLARAGLPCEPDPALEARLLRFARNARGFCLPNRRAAYDLTHIVFHATDYGRRTIARDGDLRASLINAGMVAWLEDNLDLLSEVIIALHLAGETAPETWRHAVLQGAGMVEFSPGREGARFDDDYHQYLVSNWAAAVLDQGGFTGSVPQNARLIHQPRPQSAALRELSMALLDLGDARLPDWGRMRWRLMGRLSEPTRARIAQIEGMPEFDAFFEGFSRAGRGLEACHA